MSENQNAPSEASQSQLGSTTQQSVTEHQQPSQPVPAQQPTQPPMAQPMQQAVMAQPHTQMAQATQPVTPYAQGPQVQQPVQQVPQAQPVMYAQGPQVQQPVQQVPQAQPVMYAQGPQLQQPAVRVQQVPQAQPVQYVQQPAYNQQPLVSGGVAYTAQPQPGAPQLVMNPGYFNQPDFNYTPNNYFLLTLVMAIICGIFSPLSLACSIPAVIFSVKSKNSSQVGRIKQAKREGLYAIYLLIAAILFALIVATIFTGVMIPLYRSIAFSACRYSSRRYC